MSESITTLSVNNESNDKTNNEESNISIEERYNKVGFL